MKVRCRLKKTFAKAAKIDDSIVVPSLREDLQKDLPGGTITSHISGELVGHAEEWVRNERQSSTAKIGTRIHVGNAARRSRTVLLVPPCVSDRSQSSGAINREAIWHGVLAGYDLWQGSTKECSRMDSRGAVNLLRARGVKDEVIIARRLTVLATIFNPEIRESHTSLKSKIDFGHALLISL